MQMSRYTPDTGVLDFDISTQPDDEDRIEGLAITFETGEPPVILGYIKWCAVSGFYWNWGSYGRFWELVGMCESLTDDGLRLLREHAPAEAWAWEARHRWAPAPLEWVEEKDLGFETEAAAPSFSVPWVPILCITVLIAWYFLQGA